MIGLMAYVGILLQLGWFYFLGLIGASLVSAYHYQLIKERLPEPCFKAFLHNNWLGALIFAGIFLNYL